MGEYWQPMKRKEIPIGGFRGLHEKLPPDKRPLGVVSVISNLVHDPVPSLSTRPGLTALGSIIAPVPTMLAHQYINLAGTTTKTLGQAGMQLREWDGSAWAAISIGDDAITKLANPAALPAGNGHATAFSLDGTYLAVGHDTSPFLTIYKRSGDTFTKLSDPATLPASAVLHAAWSSDGTYLATCHSTSPYITIYKRASDTFTKLADPATLPAGAGRGIAFSADGTYLAIAHVTSPFVTIYKRSSDTFTKLANPANLPDNTGESVAWSMDGTYLAVGNQASIFVSNVTIYKRSSDTFTKLSSPGDVAGAIGIVYGVAFSPDGTYLAAATVASPYVVVFKRASDTFTKLADPAALPTGQGNEVAFSPDGVYLSVAHTTSPYVTYYERSSDTFTKLADPGTLPTGTGRGTAFSPDNIYLAVAHVTSPFVTIYKRDNALRVPYAKGTGANLNDLACLFWSGNAALKWNGTALATLGGTPPQGEFVCESHEQLFVAGIPGRMGDVDGCDTADPETWTPASSNVAFSITATTSPTTWIAHDKERDKVLVWSTTGMHAIIGPETTDAPALWEVRSLSQFGTPNGRTVQDVNGTWIWLTRESDKRGFAMWGGGETVVVEDQLRTSLGLIDWDNIANAGSWLDERGRYHCSVPKTSGRMIFVYDPLTREWLMDSNEDFRTFGVVRVSGVDVPMAGNEVGEFFKVQGTDDAGTAISWSVEIGPSALGNQFNFKSVNEVWLLLSLASGATCTVSIAYTESGSYGTTTNVTADTTFSRKRVALPVVSSETREGNLFRIKVNGTGVVTIHDLLLISRTGGR